MAIHSRRLGCFAALIVAVAATGARAGAFRVAYTFRGFNDGAAPVGGLVIDRAGMLYGATRGGGARPTLFRFDPGREVLTTLHRFSPAEGAVPTGALTLGRDGTLYGTLRNGGRAGCGAVFAYAPGSGLYRTLAAFDCGTGGGHPAEGVTFGADGMLYGATTAGGTDPAHPGTVFRLDPESGAVVTVSVKGGAALGPMLAMRGALYAGGCGAVWRLPPVSVAFHLPAGACVAGTLAPSGEAGLAASVRLPGHADGAVMRADLETGTVALQPWPGSGLVASIAPGPDAMLAAVSEHGVSGIDPKSGAAKPLGGLRAAHAFAAASPNPVLAADSAALYGTTQAGGAGHGMIFEILP